MRNLLSGVLKNFHFGTRSNGDSQASQSQATDVSATADVLACRASVSNDKAATKILPLIPDSEAIIDGNMERFINTVLDKSVAELLLSKSIEDVAIAFRQIEDRIGKMEFVIAILISVIREEKLWKRFGYSSMNKFLDDLPDVCKMSRQSFTDAAQAGQVIRLLTAPLREGIFRVDFPLDYAFFYRNYAKVKFLYRIVFVWHLRLTNEILLNFRDMTYREFEGYMKRFEEQNRAEIDRYAPRSGKQKQKFKMADLPKPQKQQVPELSVQEREICREVWLGHSVCFVFTSNPACAESVLQFLQNETRREYEKLNRKYRPTPYVFFMDDPDTRPGMNGEELTDDQNTLRFGWELSWFTEEISPQAIKDALAERFKTKTELTLAQADLLYRLDHDSALFGLLKNYLEQLNIREFNPVMDFAINVLDIEVSRFKWLRRMGENLRHLARLKGRVRFTSDGFLEKLSYLGTAIQSHFTDLELVVDALNTVSAKRFREFAKNGFDNLSSDPVTLKDYLKAKPFFEKLRLYQSQGKPVTVIGLRSEREQGWLESINRAMEIGEEQLKKFYPDIVWDSGFQVEVAAIEDKTSAA
jgi:hypothetical protein